MLNYNSLESKVSKPKYNIDHGTFLPNYIKICPVVFLELRSQETYGANASANVSAACGFKNVNAFRPHITCVS
jgi:hypothetical protein